MSVSGATTPYRWALFFFRSILFKDGKWIGFVVNPNGPVDHSLPIIYVADEVGNLRGLIFNQVRQYQNNRPASRNRSRSRTGLEVRKSAYHDFSL